VTTLRDALELLVAGTERAEELGPNLTSGTYRLCPICRHDLNFTTHAEDCPVPVARAALNQEEPS
jgi:hypothetical protein